MINKNKGFTIIELLIVVAILGILATIALPNYTQYMLETRRSDAHASLLRMADLEERYYLQNNAYTNDESLVGGVNSAEQHYTLEVTAVSASGFTLTATAAATSPQVNDAGCTVINLTSAGQKTPAACW